MEADSVEGASVLRGEELLLGNVEALIAPQKSAPLSAQRLTSRLTSNMCSKVKLEASKNSNPRAFCSDEPRIRYLV